MRRASLVVAVTLLTACGTVLEPPSDPDAGPNDGGTGDVDTGPQTFCAAQQASFLMCSDFDGSKEVVQATQPGAVNWVIEKDQEDSLAIDSTVGPSNGLRSGGDGRKQAVRAQVVRSGLTAPTGTIRLSFTLRLDAIPVGGGDVYFATLGFSNVRFAAIMHADGTLDLAQLAPPASTTPVKANKPTLPVTLGSPAKVDITVNRGTGMAAVHLNGSGTDVPLVESDLGNEMVVAIGIGYCDVSCGTPSFLYDDVLLVGQ